MALSAVADRPDHTAGQKLYRWTAQDMGFDGRSISAGETALGNWVGCQGIREVTIVVTGGSPYALGILCGVSGNRANAAHYDQLDNQYISVAGSYIVSARFPVLADEVSVYLTNSGGAAGNFTVVMIGA